MEFGSQTMFLIYAIKKQKKQNTTIIISYHTTEQFSMSFLLHYNNAVMRVTKICNLGVAYIAFLISLFQGARLGLGVFSFGRCVCMYVCVCNVLASAV